MWPQHVHGPIVALERLRPMQTAHNMPKDLMFKLRLEEKDRKRLDAVAAHYEMTAAQTVRTMLKERCAELGIEPEAPKAKATKRTT